MSVSLPLPRPWRHSKLDPRYTAWSPLSMELAVSTQSGSQMGSVALSLLVWATSSDDPQNPTKATTVGVGVEYVADAVVLVVDAEDDILCGRDCTLREVNSSSRWPHGGCQLSRFLETDAIE